MRTIRRFAVFLNIQPGEERIIGLLVLLALMLEPAYVLIQSMSFGIFLAEYGPQSLPYSYILVAIVASLTALLYIKLGERISFSRTLTLGLVFLGLSSLLVWFGLRSAFFHSVAFLDDCVRPGDACKGGQRSPWLFGLTNGI